jgi:VanZ family protein
MRFLLITTLLIAYGSLYPLEFQVPLDLSIQISRLTDFRFWNSGISDAVANIFLFIPFGMAIYHAFKFQSRNTILGLVFLTFIYAYFIQICQIWTPQRIPSGGDAVWNLVGSILGMMIFTTSGQYLKNINIGNDWRRNLPIIVFACFILIDLQPFIPTFDVGTIKNNFIATLSTQGFSIIETVRHALFYFIPLTLWQLYLRDTNGPLKAMGILFAVIFLQLFIVNSGIDNNSILGAIIAVVVSGLLSNTVTTKTLLSCVTALIIFNALNAFEYRESVIFNWIPFKPALSGNTLVNIFALLEKSLFYSLFFYLCSRESIKFTQAIVTLSFVVFTLEILQTNILGATPDITENIVVLLAAYVMWKWLYKDATEPTFNTTHYSFSDMTSLFLKDSRVRIFLFYWVLAVMAQTLFMGLPNLPYNIVELYNNGGTITEFTFLYLAVFVSIGGMVWIAYGHSIKNISNAKLPLYCAYIGLITLLLLKVAVTRESIADINGSSNITYQLIGPRILGEFGYQIVMLFGEQSFRNISRFVEPFIRFASLTGPIIYFLTLFLSFSYSLSSDSKIKFKRRIIDFIKSFCFVLPWLFVCKLISFDFSSTDNLNELIARDGTWGIGGGGYLYALIITIALTVICNVHTINKKRVVWMFLALVVFILSVPTSWYFLKNGLIDSFQKYGYTFSGVDFLLGPSRSELLPESELMLRWSGVYLVVVIGLSVAILLAQKVFKNKTLVDEKKIIISHDTEQPKSMKNSKLTFNKPIFIAILLVAVLVLIGQHLFFNLATSSVKKMNWASNDANLLFDHHTHTHFSDGKLSVEELVKLSLDNGCDAIAITDHTDSKRSLTKKQLDEIKLARLFNPNLLLLSGAELNPPSYEGREHVNVLLSPDIEEKVFQALRIKVDTKDQTFNDEALFTFLNTFNTTETSMLMIYNHASRKDRDEKENKEDFLKWSHDNDIFIGFSGAPGHQKSESIGSYRGRFKTIDRWDPAIAKIGSTLDQLLDEGHDVWGAIASSDYHNEQMDYPPCGFSRIHVSAPEKTYAGLMTALKKGTFWASHGKFLSQFKIVAEVSEKQLRLSPGEASVVEAGSIALIQVEMQREADFIGLPLHVELITNCLTGEPELLDSIRVPAFKNTAAALIPINREGKDAASCYLRSRVKVQTVDGTPNMAYSNHIRFILN